MSESRAKDARVFDRDPLDWYVEPETATAQLLEVERFTGDIWDPACGGGNIVRACLDAGYGAFGSDVVCRFPELAPWWFRIADFIKDEPSRTVQNIICNPPFFRAKGTEAFIRRALALVPGKVAIFTDIKFLAGQRRGEGLWNDHPPSRVIILCERPSCPPGEYLAAGNKAEGGTADWVWLVWDQTVPRGDTRLMWIKKPAEASKI
jgi:hypothetical protein